jgi:hypothetical protein
MLFISKSSVSRWYWRKNQGWGWLGYTILTIFVSSTQLCSVCLRWNLLQSTFSANNTSGSSTLVIIWGLLDKSHANMLPLSIKQSASKVMSLIQKGSETVLLAFATSSSTWKAGRPNKTVMSAWRCYSTTWGKTSTWPQSNTISIMRSLLMEWSTREARKGFGRKHFQEIVPLWTNFSR